MRLCEDYFKELDITDEDVQGDVASQSEDAINNPEKLVDMYERSMIITTKYMPALYKHDRLWNTDMPEMIERVCYVLNAFNVDYEYIIFDGTLGQELHTYEVGRMKVLSYKTPDRFFDKLTYNRSNIVFYCNFPKLSYRESYYLIDRLHRAIWKKDVNISRFLSLMITMNPCSLYSLYDNDYFMENNKLSLIIYQNAEFIMNRNYENTPYKKFFKDALLCFNHTEEDRERIDCLYLGIFNNTQPNPFKKNT